MVSSAFLLALALRSISLLLPQTYFQPDEFYQALEPAHNLVFGYGYLSWEWRDIPLPLDAGSDWWTQHVAGGRMRSWLWPGCFALVYKLLQVLNLDQTRLIVGDDGHFRLC
jgi:phosphatidylinositol glycan class B